MEYDIDYEIYKYINELLDDYLEFDELLKQNHVTSEEARQKAEQFKSYFRSLLTEYSIGNRNLVVMCYDLIERIISEPDNSDLRYLFFCIVTDTGFLTGFDSDNRNDEQKIRNYFRQSELVCNLSDFFESQFVNRKKLYELRKHLKKVISVKDISCTDESAFLYDLTIQHSFLYKSIDNQVYKDNLNALLVYLNSDEKLKSVKPYLVFAVISRKTRMFQNRKYFIPNLKSVLQYQNYNIYRDNGKNFNNYQSAVELYDHIRNSYKDDEDTDIEFCDFCFANLSPLSEWFYMYCQPDFEIPMTFVRKILVSKSLSFPNICKYSDYTECDSERFESEHSEIVELWEKTLTSDMTEDFLNILYNGTDINQIIKKFPYSKEYSVYAEIFAYRNAEMLLEEKMLDVAEKLFEV